MIDRDLDVLVLEFLLHLLDRIDDLFETEEIYSLLSVIEENLFCSLAVSVAAELDGHAMEFLLSELHGDQRYLIRRIVLRDLRHRFDVRKSA